MVGKRAVISGGFCLIVAAMVLFLPLPWIGAMVLAASVHEMGHYFAIRILCGRGVGVHLYSFAARMPLPEMARWKECVCALAGPLAGLSLLLAARWLPRTAVFALGQSVYNLMPIYPLDGGRALCCLLSMTLPPPKVRRICKAVETACRIVVVLLAVYAAFHFDLGLLPLLAVCLFLFRVK